ncbi:MAG: CHAD domain-containing protein [Desulfuromonadales bacterium]|nr:CHAD domain-containing protein [Desulfuromonadales bacterium]
MHLDGTTPLWIAATVLVYARGEELFRRGEKAATTLDAEDIHDLRVASRRLREGLALFASCYPPAVISAVDKRVKKVTRFLGDIRNTDEAILFFTALAAELDDSCRRDLETFLATCHDDRERTVRGLESGLRKIAAGRLSDLYLRTLHSLSLFTPPDNGIDLFSPLSGFAKDALDQRLSTIRELLPQAREPGAIEAQHRLRIAVKHFRYRMELLSFLVRAEYPLLHGLVKGYQDVLGTMHDLDVFSGIVREAGFPAGTEKMILDAMDAKRGKLFLNFSGMLVAQPLEQIGERVRDLV